MNTIKKSVLLEADKLATLYAGELRGKGFTPSKSACVTSEKVFRVEFQNGVLNQTALRIGRLAAWAALAPTDDIEIEFSSSCQRGESFHGGRIIFRSGGSEIQFLNHCKIEPGIMDVPPIRFDDKHTGNFELQTPAETGDLTARIKANKAANAYRKLRETELGAKRALKLAAAEHCNRLALLAGGTAPAIAQTRAIVAARRTLRAALKITNTKYHDCPAWFSETARAEYAALMADFDAKAQAVADYKPRMVKGRWDDEKKPVYGPKYTALCTARDEARKQFAAVIIRQWEAVHGEIDTPYVRNGVAKFISEPRPYSRARLAVKSWTERKWQLAKTYTMAIAARRKSEPKLAAAGGVITASATLADGRKLDKLTFSADIMEKQVLQARETGATIHIHASNHPLYPVGDILPQTAGEPPVADEPAPVAHVAPEIAAAFGMENLPNVVIVPQDPNIGREWQSPYGPQKIVRRENMPAGDLYDVETAGTGAIRRYDVARIEETIATDEHRLTPAYAAEVAERQETARLRAASDARQAAKQAIVESEIASFTAGLSAMLAGKHKATLLKLVRHNGHVMTRKTMIENKVSAGSIVKTNGTIRELWNIDDTFLSEAQTTIAGMDYALYLIAKRGEIAAAPPAIGSNVTLPDIRVTVADGRVTQYEVLTRAGGIWTRGVVMIGAPLAALQAVFDDLIFEVIQAPAPLKIACEFVADEPQPVAVTVAAPSGALPARHEGLGDFGEKIHGARKDTWGTYAKAMAETLPSDYAKITLASHFPEPDYETAIKNGALADNLAAMKALRDLIPAKPRKAYKLQRWGELVTLAHGIVQRMAAGQFKMTAQRLDEITAGIGGEVAAKVNFYRALGYPLFTRADGWKIETGRFSTYDGVTFANGYRAITYAVKDRRWMKDLKSENPDPAAATAEVLTQVKAAIAGEIGQPGEKRQTHFGLYSERRDATFFIGKKGLRGVLRIKTGFKTVTEARQFLAESRTELETIWETMKAAPQLRKAANQPRLGPDLRPAGENVTPDKFAATFGFRGVQFGNYVETARRQADLNEAHDALLDLASALNLPPAALSLAGTLGLAFGARGRGGDAIAHYEPGQIVINITKTRGPGSLAHEWFHALDNYFARLGETGRTDGVCALYATAGTVAKLRPEVADAFRALRRALSVGTFASRSDTLDATRAKPYYGTTIEKAARAFEIFISDRLETRGVFNDYLANIYKGAEAACEWDGCAYPYQREMDQDGIRAAYDSLFNTIQATDNRLA